MKEELSMHTFRSVPTDLMKPQYPSSYTFGDGAPAEGGSPALLFHPQALEALKSGLQVREARYHLVLTGSPGSGRSALAEEAVRQAPPAGDAPDILLAEIPDGPYPFSPVFVKSGEARAFLDALDAGVDGESPESFLYPGRESFFRRIRGGLGTAHPDWRILKSSAAEGARTAPFLKEAFTGFDSLFGHGDKAISRNRCGLLHHGDGSVLILSLEALLQDSLSWSYLLKALHWGGTPLYRRDSHREAPVPLTRPLPFTTKILLIGDEGSYDQLYDSQEDFGVLFPVHAEMEELGELDAPHLASLAAFLGAEAVKRGWTGIDEGAFRELVRYSCRFAEQNNRLDARTAPLIEVLKEASGLPRRGSLSGDEVRRVLAGRYRRAALPEVRQIEMITSGEILINLQGKEIGVINGLAVYERGYFTFGVPCRISAGIAPGEIGIVNIEKEVGLSGEIHDKWMLIIEGFLRTFYARQFPLSLYSNIYFEQSYNEIDGDSASSSELLAILSSIAGVPLRQDLAVTGSVNQSGLIQPVGGVTEKIEGFFHVCTALGLTGTQGVIIPEQNVNNLVLEDEVIGAVEAGLFHIYTARTVNDCIEMLTGQNAGRRGAAGKFPAGSFNRLVEKNLLSLAEKTKGLQN